MLSPAVATMTIATSCRWRPLPAEVDCSWLMFGSVVKNPGMMAAWLPHVLLVHAVVAGCLVPLSPAVVWVDPFAALSVALGSTYRIQVAPPLGLAIDAGSAVLLKISPLLAALSTAMGAWGLADVLAPLRGPGREDAVSVMATVCRGPLLWLLSGLLHGTGAAWAATRTSSAELRFAAVLGAEAVGAAQRERPVLPLTARLHPLLFPYKAFEIQQEDVPGGATVDMWPLQPGGGDAARPIFFFVHGGAWRGGNSRMNPSCLLLHRLSMRGWQVCAVNYRKRRWPQHIEDCGAALRFVLGRAPAEQDGEPLRVVVGGASAGGHLAALLASQPEFAPALRGAVLLYPALDPADDMQQFLPWPFGPSTIRWFFQLVVLRGNRDFWDEAKPLAQITPAFPPCLAVHGELDGLAPVVVSRAFFAGLAAARSCPRDFLVEVPGAKHSFEVGGGPMNRVVLDGIVAWLRPIEEQIS
mmetsp:Transcript_30238/g.96363  ORF Transcript_30238/g.96363 Transcript_30238/m.96363 type:complete len:469 (+) Transcript_30238:78-1484(+)